jgi:hypothetical protein
MGSLPNPAQNRGSFRKCRCGNAPDASGRSTPKPPNTQNSGLPGFCGFFRTINAEDAEHPEFQVSLGSALIVRDKPFGAIGEFGVDRP